MRAMILTQQKGVDESPLAQREMDAVLALVRPSCSLASSQSLKYFSVFLHSLLYTLGYPKTWSDRAKILTLPRWFGWEAGLFLLAPQTSEDVQHSGHERIWARVRPERYGFKRWNIGLERPEDHPPCRQFLR